MDDLRPKLEKIFADLKSEIASLRTGRATPALVEDLEIEAYGVRQPLKAIAAISASEPRQIVIQPWDKTLLPAIEKAIQVSPLGLNPIADKDTIRLALPTLTEERKRDLVKLLKEKLESSRIQVRRVRDEAMKEIDARAKVPRPSAAKPSAAVPASRLGTGIPAATGGLGKISEDEKFRQKQEAEKTVGEINRKIEELGQAKEREIMAG